MDAPPPEVFKAAGLLVGFVIAYWIVFRPKRRPEDES